MLAKVIEMVSEENWYMMEAISRVQSTVYPLRRMDRDKKSGAGQYFTQGH